MTSWHKDYLSTRKLFTKTIPKKSIFRHFSGVLFIHKLKNDVFVHDFLSHQTSELPEIWNLSKHWTNLKNNEENSHFSLFSCNFSIFFVVFRVFMNISAISAHKTMKFWQSEYFQIWKMQNKCLWKISIFRGVALIKKNQNFGQIF